MCGEKHWGRNCAGKLICFKCQKEGHISTACPTSGISKGKGAPSSGLSNISQVRPRYRVIRTLEDGMHEEIEGNISSVSIVRVVSGTKLS